MGPAPRGARGETGPGGAAGGASAPSAVSEHEAHGERSLPPLPDTGGAFDGAFGRFAERFAGLPDVPTLKEVVIAQAPGPAEAE